MTLTDDQLKGLADMIAELRHMQCEPASFDLESVASAAERAADALAATDREIARLREAVVEPRTVAVPVRLMDCPPGLFMFDGCLGFKTEYATIIGSTAWPEAYVVASGEYFWGGTATHKSRAELMVTPLFALAPKESGNG